MKRSLLALAACAFVLTMMTGCQGGSGEEEQAERRPDVEPRPAPGPPSGLENSPGEGAPPDQE